MKIKRGRPANALPERNKNLFDDWKSGKFSTAQMVGKYKVSQTRLYQIINSFKKGQHEQNGKTEGSESQEGKTSS